MSKISRGYVEKYYCLIVGNHRFYVNDIDYDYNVVVVHGLSFCDNIKNACTYGTLLGDDIMEYLKKNFPDCEVETEIA